MRPLRVVAALGFAIVPFAADAEAPLTYMRAHGALAYPVTALAWGMLAISLLVILIVAALVMLGIARGRRRPAFTPEGVPIVERPEGGLGFIWIGTGISAAVLFAAAIWSFATLGAISVRADNAPFAIEVKGHQWWWEVRYIAQDSHRIFTTANEIHIPIGKAVQVKLIGTDVIHSFWVPRLMGKTDIVPGQENITSLEAGKPGTYRGQCTEYCGQQHAKMAFLVVAEEEGDFQRWWDGQLEGVGTLASREAAQGQVDFTRRCGACHAVRGTQAGGAVGPDLSHLMTRQTLASGILPNNMGYLSGWIADPQRIKPGSPMPKIDLSAEELTNIRSFLAALD